LKAIRTSSKPFTNFQNGVQAIPGSPGNHLTEVKKVRKIVRQDGKRVWLDTAKDELLYDGATATAQKTNKPWNNINRGLDLYYHLCSDGKRVYYLYHWSKWEGEMSYIDGISLDDAQKFIEENIDIFDDDDITTLEELGLINLAELE